MSRVIGVLILLSAVGVSAQPFHEDFESSLNQWTGKSDGPHNGIVVVDPLNAANHVLSFAATTHTGDVFSRDISVAWGASYLLSFEYLGLPIAGTPPDDTAGMIGISNGLPGNYLRWIAGTIDDNNIVVELVDDGQWHSYSVLIDVSHDLYMPNGTLHITLEDWDGAACVSCTTGVAGDAFFDNISFIPAGSVLVRPDTWGKVKSLYE